MACCVALRRTACLAPCGRPTPTAAAVAAARRSLAPRHPLHRAVAAAAQAASQQQPDGSNSLAARGGAADSSGSPGKPRRLGRQSIISRDSEGDIAAARQRLQAYLQQQGGISQAEAAELAGKLSDKLGGAADQLVPPPQQWLVGRGMQPVNAAQLLAHMCDTAAQHASVIRNWPTWQPVLEVNWQLADSCLAAYQQQCKATKQRPLKSSRSVAVLLSGQPSRYHLLLVPDLRSRVDLVQQQLGRTEAELGELIAAGLALFGTEATLAADVQWLVSFAGSREAATSMLRRAPAALSYSAAMLDSKAAALQAAWTGVLQPEQVRQLVQRAPKVLSDCKAGNYANAAEVLRSWFPQPSELYALLSKAPKLLSTSAASLEANERWFTSPPLSLSRQQFLALVRAAPQAFSRNMAAPPTQHKLAFVTQVVGVPLERALSASQLTYLKSGLTALAGRYFLLTEHGVPLPRHKDGSVVLTYASVGLPTLLQRMRPHDSQQCLPADDDAAVEYLDQWLTAWPATDSGRQWAQPPQPAADA